MKEGTTVLIVYCDSCGTLMKSDAQSQRVTCAECSSGVYKIRRDRDSGEIPAARRPTATKILRKIRQNLPA
jgi:hypothetical protein